MLMPDGGVQSGFDLEKLMKRRECCGLDMNRWQMYEVLVSEVGTFGKMNALLGR